MKKSKEKRKLIAVTCILLSTECTCWAKACTYGNVIIARLMVLIALLSYLG